MLAPIAFIRVNKHGEPILNLFRLGCEHGHKARNTALQVSLGRVLIVQAFLRWADTAKAGERAKAANALGRAYLSAGMDAEQRRGALMAMTCLLDDPAPIVRLALAEVLAQAAEAPRAIMLSLAHDQPEIACHAIYRSPVLTDADLVDIAGHGDSVTRGLVASRPGLTRGVAAAIAEIGEESEVLLLLENAQATISRMSLTRIAARLGHLASIRNLLLERKSLPADARHLLVQHVGAALSSCNLICKTLLPSRIDHLTREAMQTATITICGAAAFSEIPVLVEHLRSSGQLTPAFLIHALCSGKLDFFAAAIVQLSGVEEKRAHAILATGRPHAVRALVLSSGIRQEAAPVFVDAILLWRKETQRSTEAHSHSIASQLLAKYSDSECDTNLSSDLIDMLGKLHIAQERQLARSFAQDIRSEAA